MSKAAKKVSFPSSIPKPQRAIEEIEGFVAAGGAAQEAVVSAPSAPASPAEETKRLTIDISESLHKRLRFYAAADGRRLADIVRELLDVNLPKV